MNILVSLPSLCEADVEFFPDSNKLVVQPVFTASRDRKVVLYLAVTGTNGRERLFTVDVSGTTGKLALTEVRRVVAAFDQQAAGAEDEVAPADTDQPEPLSMNLAGRPVEDR